MCARKISPQKKQPSLAQNLPRLSLKGRHLALHPFAATSKTALTLPPQRLLNSSKAGKPLTSSLALSMTKQTFRTTKRVRLKQVFDSLQDRVTPNGQSASWVTERFWLLP